MDGLPDENGGTGPVGRLGHDPSSEIDQRLGRDPRAAPKRPQVEAGRLAPPRPGRRVSLLGWGIGLAISLGLWAALYYLFF